MARMQRILREENENIIKVKAMNDNKLPQGMLFEGKMAINRFVEMKKLDAVNEKMPQRASE